MFLLNPLAILCAILAGIDPAFAHTPAEPVARSVAWDWQPWILASLALSAAWYGTGAARLRARAETARLIGRGQITAYCAGLATLFIALVSPLDSIAGQLFWVHMMQHLLLLLVAAPLLVLGRPALAFLWAFGLAGRKRVGRVWTALGLHRGIQNLLHPIVVWALFCGGFILWHLPGPYQAALRNEGIHTLEHLSFLVTALMFWSIVIEPSGRRRLDYGPTLVFVTTAAILSGLPGALITLAPRPLYPAHAAGAAAWGLTLLQDQQLAGLVMWIPGGFVFLGAVAFVFVKWLEQGDRRLAPARRAALPLLLVCVTPLLLAGCGDGRAQSGAARDEQKRGAGLVASYGCGSCHTIPGVTDANGVVGPPLTQMGRRVYIAGLLRNTPDNMVSWLRNPQRIVPGNVMPDMGLSEGEARDVAAYLNTLR
jgi:cytochrome c oxidase assembly factor CtaG